MTGLREDEPENDRLLAMIRRSLVMTEPMTKVDAICELLQRRLAARAAQTDARIERVEALATSEPMCWVSRTEGIHCTDFIGGVFDNGAIWQAEMCCLPCRLRAALTSEPQP